MAVGRYLVGGRGVVVVVVAAVYETVVGERAQEMKKYIENKLKGGNKK